MKKLFILIVICIPLFYVNADLPKVVFFVVRDNELGYEILPDSVQLNHISGERKTLKPDDLISPYEWALPPINVPQKHQFVNKIYIADNFPNPFCDFTNFRIQSEINGLLKIEVFDVTGRLVLNRAINLNNGANNLNLDFNIFPDGIYFTIFHFNNEFILKKISKSQVKSAYSMPVISNDLFPGLYDNKILDGTNNSFISYSSGYKPDTLYEDHYDLYHPINIRMTKNQKVIFTENCKLKINIPNTIIKFRHRDGWGEDFTRIDTITFMYNYDFKNAKIVNNEYTWCQSYNSLDIDCMYKRFQTSMIDTSSKKFINFRFHLTFDDFFNNSRDKKKLVFNIDSIQYHKTNDNEYTAIIQSKELENMLHNFYYNYNTQFGMGQVQYETTEFVEFLGFDDNSYIEIIINTDEGL